MADMGDTAAVGPPPPRANPILIGHEAAEATLLDAWRAGRLAHAWLLAGPKGIGKATLAYRIARRVLAGDGERGDLFGAPAPDMDEDDPVFRRIAAGAHSGLLTIEPGFDDRRKRRRDEILIGEIHPLAPFLRLTTGEGAMRVVVVDAADQLNRTAANALLKSLEEPPYNVLFLLVCHNQGAILPTVRSRCRLLPLRPLEDDALAAFLARFRPALAPEQRAAVARLARGSPGRALRLVDAGGLDLYAAMIAVLAEEGSARAAALHALADRLGRGGEAEAAFDALLEALADWIARMVRDAAAGREGGDVLVPGEAAIAARLAAGAGLAHWTEVWEKVRRLAAQAAHANLDRRQALIAAFRAVEAAPP